MIYLLVSVLIYFFGLLNFSKYKRTTIVFISLGYMLFIGLGKFNFTDTSSYIDFYENYFTPITRNFQWPEVNFEPLFILLGCSLKTISKEYYFYQVSIVTIEFLLIYRGLSTIDSLKPIVIPLLAILFFPMISNLLAAQRQGIAFALFVFSFKYIINKNYIKLLLIIGIGALFHFSMLFLVFFIFLPRSFNLNKRLLIILFLTANLFYFNGIFLNEFFQEKFGFIFGTELVRYKFDSDLFESAGLLKVIEVDVIYIVLFLLRSKRQTNFPEIFYYGFLFYFFNNLLLSGITSYRINIYLSVFYYLAIFQITYIFIKSYLKDSEGLKFNVLTYSFTYIFVIILFLFKFINLLSSQPSPAYFPYQNYLF